MLTIEELEQVAVTALEALKGNDIRVIDVSRQTDIADRLIIASGTSHRHVRSLADQVVVAAKGVNHPPLGREGEQGGEWALVDLGEIVIHVMMPETRDYYNLEKFWQEFKREQD